MFVNKIPQKEKVDECTKAELRNLGVPVKLRSKKNARVEKVERVNVSRKLLCTPLHLLPTKTTSLSSGVVVQVSSFVVEAIQFLKQEERLTLEGLFRKAGSKVRQTELMSRVDNGGKIGDDFRPIEVANCLKAFFCQLPEPLVPRAYHDLFVHCFTLKTGKVQAILLACLLLPVHHLEILAFLVEFLRSVAMYEKSNRMSIDSLAKMFMPSIIPCETTMLALETRMEIHLAITKTLIQNAEKIGMVPEKITDTLSSELPVNGDTEPQKAKKKKSRNGSLNRMLSGIRKIVSKNNLLDSETIEESGRKEEVVETGISKAGKKRRVGESTMSIVKNFFSEKKRHVDNSDSSVEMQLAENKDKGDKCKKSRLSFERFKAKQKVCETEVPKRQISPSPQIRRRWNSLGSTSKIRSEIRDSQSLESLENPQPEIVMYENGLVEANVNLSDSSFSETTTIAKNEMLLRKLKSRHSKITRTRNSLPAPKTCESPDVIRKSNANCKVRRTKSIDPAWSRLIPDLGKEEAVIMTRSQYENMQSRIKMLEKRCSRDFRNDVSSESVDSVKSVQKEYRKTLEEADVEQTNSADRLARRLSRDLRIRRPGENGVFRSPSARRIGNIRRKSKERTPRSRLNRMKSWHSPGSPRSIRDANYQRPTSSKAACLTFDDSDSQALSSCSDETNARLDILQEQLHSLISRTVEHTQSSLPNERHFDHVFATPDQKWIKTPRHKTQSSSSRNPVEKEIWVSGGNPDKIFTPDNALISQTGRPSVARLRYQMRGKVLQTAKLFDDTTSKCSNPKDEFQVEPRVVTRQQNLDNFSTPKRVEKSGKRSASGSGTSEDRRQENESLKTFTPEVNADTSKTPQFKKQLLMMSPKSTKIIRRTVMRNKNTPLKATMPMKTKVRES